MKTLCLLIATILLFCSACDFSSDVCQASGITCPSGNSLQLGSETINAYEFDAISFGDFSIGSGDTEGRVAIKGNLMAYGGVSFGEKITASIGYTLVVGGNVNWVDSGEVYPLGEGIFIGGSITALPDNLRSRVTGNCSSSGCADASFSNLESYWTSFSNSLASARDNVDFTLTSGALSLTCQSSSASVYFVSIDAATFSQVRNYVVNSGCNAGATWVFNIGGTSDVRFDGLEISVSGTVIFNIPSSLNVITVTSVYGNIVAPAASFNQQQGTVTGQVIAKSFFKVIQINRPNCPPSTTGQQPSSTTGQQSATTGQQTVTTGQQQPSSTTGQQSATTGQQQPSSSTGQQPSSTTSQQPTVTTGQGQQSTGNQQTGSTGQVSGSTSGQVSGSTSGQVNGSTSGQVSGSTSNEATTGQECVCPPNPPVNPPAQECPFIDFVDTCPGFSFTLGSTELSFTNFHVISFGNFVANTGDVEGRLAVKGSVTLGGGYSIGDKVVAIGNTPSDRASAYSLIAGSLNWGSGSLLPDGSASTAERAFVAGSNTSPSYITGRVDGPCSDASCLESAFSGALGCYNGLQSELAGYSNNVETQLKYSGIQLTCSSTSSGQYVATIDGALFAQATWFNLINCQSNARWIINVNGSSDVSFHGDSFPAVAENVVFNILGSGRTISVNTAVNGAILAPNNFLSQTGGVIRGKVVIGDARAVVQINKPICVLDPVQTARNSAMLYTPSFVVATMIALLFIF